MEFKTLFGLTVIPAVLLGASALGSVSKRVRDVFFVLLVVLTPVMERLDIHFVSRAWYRGTALGFQVSLLDILAVGLLVGSLVAPRRGQARWFWPPGVGLPALFFLYACFSVLISEPKLFGIFELFKMARGLIFVLAAAFYLRSERELRLFVTGLALLVCLEGVLALKERYLNGSYRVPGTVDDANSLSMLLCLTTPVMLVAVYTRFPVALRILCAGATLLAGVAEVMTISRTGITTMCSMLLAATAATLSWRVTLRKVAWGSVIALVVAAIAAKSWHTVMARFHDTDLKEEYTDHRVLGRGYYLRVAAAIVRSDWLGVGLNNWSYWVSNRYGPKLGYRFVPYRGTDMEPSHAIPSGSNVDEAQAAPAHCLGALTAGELGIPGLLLFTLVWARWLQMGASFLWPRFSAPMHRVGVGLFFGFCGMFLQSLTEWVFRQPPLFFMFHLLLGVMASLYYLRRSKAQSAARTEPSPSVEVFVPCH